MMSFSFRKWERLKSKKEIDNLFNLPSISIKCYPLIFRFQINHGAKSSMKVAFSISKRKVRLATKRNKIKRHMVEVYRKNKHIILQNPKFNNHDLNGVFIFMPHELVSQAEIRNSIHKIFEKLSQYTGEGNLT